MGQPGSGLAQRQAGARALSRRTLRTGYQGQFQPLIWPTPQFREGAGRAAGHGQPEQPSAADLAAPAPEPEPEPQIGILDRVRRALAEARANADSAPPSRPRRVAASSEVARRKEAAVTSLSESRSSPRAMAKPLSELRPAPERPAGGAALPGRGELLDADRSTPAAPASTMRASVVEEVPVIQGAADPGIKAEPKVRSETQGLSAVGRTEKPPPKPSEPARPQGLISTASSETAPVPHPSPRGGEHGTVAPRPVAQPPPARPAGPQLRSESGSPEPMAVPTPASPPLAELAQPVGPPGQLLPAPGRDVLQARADPAGEVEVRLSRSAPAGERPSLARGPVTSQPMAPPSADRPTISQPPALRPIDVPAMDDSSSEDWLATSPAPEELPSEIEQPPVAGEASPPAPHTGPAADTGLDLLRRPESKAATMSAPKVEAREQAGVLATDQVNQANQAMDLALNMNMKRPVASVVSALSATPEPVQRTEDQDQPALAVKRPAWETRSESPEAMSGDGPPAVEACAEEDFKLAPVQGLPESWEDSGLPAQPPQPVAAAELAHGARPRPDLPAAARSGRSERAALPQLLQRLAEPPTIRRKPVRPGRVQPAPDQPGATAVATPPGRPTPAGQVADLSAVPLQALIQSRPASAQPSSDAASTPAPSAQLAASPAAQGTPTSPDSTSQEGPPAFDLEQIARQVYEILRRRLHVEEERAGGWSR